MADVYTKDEFEARSDELLPKLKHAVFIYPTDTIYGIGCDATDDTLVQRIRELKGRETKPFSVIAPSKEWIRANCEVDDRTEEWLAKLPGPYTLILRLKKQECIAPSVNEEGETLGVRIPAHWMSDVVRNLNIPVVTTSANRSGRPNMTTLDDLDRTMKEAVEIILYEGPRTGKPSTIVRLDTDELEVTER